MLRALISHQNDATTACGDFLHIGDCLFKDRIMRRDDDDGHGFINQGNRPMLQLASGIAFRVDVRDFFQLQRAFEGERIARAATKI